ncbi:MAG: nucleoside hydrolase [Marinilabiliaceae bacterium]|nr:nucleoside hydrolase [Marinilabiliaceae bacterium]
MKKLTGLIVLIFVSLSLFSHPWQPSHYVVIDTDAGIDDMRAISMLLASDDVQILGIIISGGALSPYDGYKKVKSMLNAYHHEGIPVAMNYNRRGSDMPVPLAVRWGNEDIPVPETNGFNTLCKNILSYRDKSFKLISLASLNSADQLLSTGILPADRLSEIIWSNNSLNNLDGFNAGIDIKSARGIIKGDVKLTVVGYPSSDFYDQSFLMRLQETKTPYAQKIFETAVSSPDLQNHTYAARANDEMTAIYLFYPELFSNTAVKQHSFCKPLPGSDLKGAALKILGGTDARGLQTIKQLPADPGFYQEDLGPFLDEIISKHGDEEWRAAVLTNEIHQHLGIYSIVGVKMGIRAREFFKVGVDQMKVVSYAGSEPPLSCLNDGIQVSTGATIGHGLIEVQTENTGPAVKFSYMGKSITIKLKDELAAELKVELQDLVLVNGLDSDIYWELLRQRAILYWKNLDRNEIFEISE